MARQHWDVIYEGTVEDFIKFLEDWIERLKVEQATTAPLDDFPTSNRSVNFASEHGDGMDDGAYTAGKAVRDYNRQNQSAGDHTSVMTGCEGDQPPPASNGKDLHYGLGQRQAERSDCQDENVDQSLTQRQDEEGDEMIEPPNNSDNLHDEEARQSVNQDLGQDAGDDMNANHENNQGDIHEEGYPKDVERGPGLYQDEEGNRDGNRNHHYLSDSRSSVEGNNTVCSGFFDDENCYSWGSTHDEQRNSDESDQDSDEEASTDDRSSIGIEEDASMCDSDHSNDREVTEESDRGMRSVEGDGYIHDFGQDQRGTGEDEPMCDFDQSDNRESTEESDRGMRSDEGDGGVRGQESLCAAADRILRITPSTSALESWRQIEGVASTSANHSTIKSLLQIEVDHPRLSNLASQSDQRAVAEAYSRYSAELLEQTQRFKRLSRFTGLILVSWCVVLESTGTPIETVNSIMLSRWPGSERNLTRVRGYVKKLHRIINELSKSGWHERAFEIFFLRKPLKAIVSDILTSSDAPPVTLFRKLTGESYSMFMGELRSGGKGFSEPHGWIPYSIPCIVSVVAGESLQ